MKYLIINADDFGYSYSINKGIIEAHEKGMVTSTTVLVDSIAASEASDFAKYLNLSVGLHFYPTTLDDVEAELERQVELFVSIVGRRPDSIDSHKRNTREVPDIEKALKKYSLEFKTPIRDFGYVNFIDSFFANNRQPDEVNIDKFKNAVDLVKDGYNELMCHVGHSDEHLRENSSYSDIREEELKTITSEEAINYIKQKEIDLINWNFVKDKQF